jgi:hypothetical protein
MEELIVPVQASIRSPFHVRRGVGPIMVTEPLDRER